MKCGRAVDDALRAILYLAGLGPGELRSGRQIAAVIGAPASSLQRNVLPQLVRAGIVEAAAGPGGGYALARPAGAVGVLEVIEALEGRVRLQTSGARGCDAEVWARAEAIRGRLERAIRAGLRVSIGELLEKVQA